MKKNLKLLEKLDDGGFADIWRAYDEVLEREVAVKIIREAIQSHRHTLPSRNV